MIRNHFEYRNYIDIDKINRAVYDAKEFINRCENDYFTKINDTVDYICQRASECAFILLAGPSSSGKTTTANLISRHLTERGIRSETVSMDDYYKTVCRDSKSIDLESPERLDIDMLKQDFRALAAGAEVRLPVFDFKTGIQSMSDKIIKSGKDSIVIFEGIHALSDLFDEAENAIRIYVSPRMRIIKDDEIFLTPEELRFIRRCTRDIRFRGADFERTLSLWPNVIRGERRFVLPSKQNADIQIDTSFGYEPCLFAGLSKKQISLLPENDLADCGLQGIAEKMDAFKIIEPKLVPAGSLMREFIGNEL